jgi:hypothetical protein
MIMNPQLLRSAVTTLLIVMSLLAPAAAERTFSTTYDPDVLRVVCRYTGGTYAPPSPECNGCFFCVSADGTTTACDGDGQCTVTTPLTSGQTARFQQSLPIGLLQLLPEPQPDLVPLPAPATIPPEGFCQRNDQGQLLLNVYNQGGVEAVASKTRVIFGTASPADFDTPSVAAGTGTQLIITIPEACFDTTTQQCRFTVGVDATAAVAESNETNNNAAGLCGPQFQ